MILKCNPNATFSAFSDATIAKKWLCSLPDSKGKEYRITITDNVYQFIKLFDGSKSVHETIEYFNENSALDITERSRFEALVADFLLVKKILIQAGNGVVFADDLPKKAQHLQFQLPVLKANIVNKLAPFLQFFYQAHITVLMLIVIGISQIIFYVILEPDFLIFWQLSAIEQIQIILLASAGLLFHELGHASAAYRYQCRNIDIGVGWYVIFLVFYAELSECWRLKRRERVIIDSSGLYFQGIFTAALIFWLSQTNSAPAFYAIILLNLSFLWNLNPFFRMDGYWIASDILGITNLRAAANKEFNRLFNKCLGRSNQPSDHDLPRKAKHALMFYTIISNLFFCWMIYVIGNRLLTTITIELQTKLKYINDQSVWQYNWPELLLFMGGLIGQILLLTFFCFFLYQASKRIFRGIKRILSR